MGGGSPALALSLPVIRCLVEVLPRTRGTLTLFVGAGNAAGAPRTKSMGLQRRGPSRASQGYSCSVRCAQEALAEAAPGSSANLWPIDAPPREAVEVLQGEPAVFVGPEVDEGIATASH
eukprot:CAMPEP_0115345866 /NCGR_PEP_ID=MMETSP0270-20121206/94043_1 /TAXON_ID=71861 /ORGANISM="Scrippsiella trochoidea, Strain CCMP3099" /LENGTH=118 /DNA_ID=CAMNT_0002767685 /DNA_START=136 /DNA_END=494 /DNA_ORIENTATION=+